MARQRQDDARAQAAAGTVLQPQRAAVGDGHGTHDRQAQARARQGFAGAAAREALLHGLLFIVGDAGAAVGHGQRHPVAGHRRGLDVHRTVGSVAQRVVDQIAQHFAQRHAVAGDAGAPHLGRDVDAQPPRFQRTDAAARFIDRLGHADRRARALAEPVRDGGVHQQLVDQLTGMRGVLVDALDAGVQALGVGFFQRDLGLRA